MVLRQIQLQNRRVWNIPDDRNSRIQVPKHQDTCQLFGAYLPVHKWFFVRILKKSDFYDFNELHDIRDAKRNIRKGMVGLFYKEVCSVGRKSVLFQFV